MNRPTDQGIEVLEWIAELQQGNDIEVNSRRIFSRYYGWVRRFFTRRHFSLERAEELTQETFLQAFQRLGSFRGDGTFESWLFAVAANGLRNEWRSLSRQKRDAPEISLDVELPRGGLPEVDEGVASPEGIALHKERLMSVMRAIELLPKKPRDCLRLRLAGYDYAKIAELLKLSPSTARVHVHTARKRLRETLEGELGHWIE